MRVVPVFCFALLVCTLHITTTQAAPETQESEPSEEIDVRVVNGQNARLREFPWQVSLRKKGNNFHFCGGSLISRNLVLTAAHCVDQMPNPRSYKVVLGARTRTTRTRGEETRGVTKVYHHRYFSRSHFRNDVALLWLDKPVRLTKNIKTIQLPRQGSKVAVGTRCVISGWGRTRGGGHAANVLQKAVLPIAHHYYCSKKNNPLFRKVKVHYNSMICAGGQGRAGGCQGDSGGPLACKERRRWILRGVVSWGQPKCSVRHYTVFARVSSFRNWINYYARRG